MVKVKAPKVPEPVEDPEVAARRELEEQKADAAELRAQQGILDLRTRRARRQFGSSPWGGSRVPRSAGGSSSRVGGGVTFGASGPPSKPKPGAYLP